MSQTPRAGSFRHFSQVGLVSFALLLGMLAYSADARADLILTFDQTFTGPAESPANTPYATLAVSQYLGNADEIEITETLGDATKFRFHQNNGTHVMLAFNLPTLTLTGLTANSHTFTPGMITLLSPSPGSGIAFATSAGPAGYPSFGYGLSCGSPACGSGFGGGFAGTLQFVITSATAITPSAFGTPSVSGGVNYYATSDFVASTGVTGNVASTTKSTSSIGEPDAILVLCVGLAALLLGRVNSRGLRGVPTA